MCVFEECEISSLIGLSGPCGGVNNTKAVCNLVSLVFDIP